jgi:hypothetical protein
MIFEKLDEIFQPYYCQKIKDMVQDDDLNFAYYTSLENIHHILTEETLWLRNVSCMNDFSEVRQGVQVLKNYFFTGNTVNEHFERAISVLASITTAFDWEQVLRDLLDNMESTCVYTAYILSMTVHNKVDDTDGRLSMWRGYGRSDCGAFIIDKRKILQNIFQKDLDVSISPVVYFTNQEAFNQNIDCVVDSIEENRALLLHIKPGKLWNRLKFAIISAALSIKHSGFKEEQEWRIIHIDNSPFEAIPYKGQTISSDIRCIEGIPQKICFMHLQEGLAQILDHVVIGPTQFSPAIYTAVKIDLMNLLGDNFVEGKYIRQSTIPIRHECL